MPGAFDKFVNQYDPDIQQLLGNIDDLRVTNSYNDALKEINQNDADRQSIQRFYDLAKKINGLDRNMIPDYNTIEEDQFNYEDPRLYQSDNELNKKYADYVQNWKTANGKETGYLDFGKFIEAVPGLKDQMMLEGYYKKSQKQVPLNEQEMQQKIYETAGFTPEDIPFYEAGLNNPDLYSQDRYNEKMQNLAYKYYPQLTSRGQLGNSLQSLLGDRLAGKVLNIQQTKNGEWKFEIENGHVIKYNTANGQYSVTNIDKQKEATTKNWEIFEDDNGNPYWGERVQDGNGKWVIEPRAELDKTEKRDYENDLQIQQNKVNNGNKKTRSSKGPGRYKKFSVDRMDVNDMKNIKPGDIGTKYKTVEQLDELQKNSNYLTEETRAAIEDYLQQGPEPDYANESDDNTYDYFVEYAKDMDDKWSSGDKEGFSQMQDNFLKDLDRYAGYLSKDDYRYFADRYKKY